MTKPDPLGGFARRLRAARTDEARTALLRAEGRGMAAEHGAGYRAVLAALPAGGWAEDPIVAATRGVSFRGDGEDFGTAGLDYLRAAERASLSAPDADRVSILVDEAAALRALGRLADASALTVQARELLDGTAVTLQERVALSARVALAEAVDALHAGDIERAGERASIASRLGESSLGAAELIEALGALALSDFARDRLDSAAAQAMLARRIGEGTPLMANGYGTLARCAEIMVALERGAESGVRSLLPELAASARGGEWDPFARIIEAQVLEIAGDFIGALDALQRADDLYRGWQPHGFGSVLGRGLRVKALIQLEQVEEAGASLESLPDIHNHFFCTARLRAGLALTLGDLDAADAAIAGCEWRAEAHSPRALLEVHLLRAAVEHVRGNFRVADVAVDRALLGMARSGSPAPLRHVPAAIRDTVLERAVGRAQASAVRSLLAVARGRADLERDPLSEQERRVLAAAETGRTVGEIARVLYISPNTVKTHLRRVYRKLGVNTREEAVRRARTLGALGAGPDDSPGRIRSATG